MSEYRHREQVIATLVEGVFRLEALRSIWEIYHYGGQKKFTSKFLEWFESRPLIFTKGGKIMCKSSTFIIYKQRTPESCAHPPGNVNG
jgi:hypothetical protein